MGEHSDKRHSHSGMQLRSATFASQIDLCSLPISSLFIFRKTESIHDQRGNQQTNRANRTFGFSGEHSFQAAEYRNRIVHKDKRF